MTETANKFIENRQGLWSQIGAIYKQINSRIIIVLGEDGTKLRYRKGDKEWEGEQYD
jgi:hypothetical protein|tara:strand:+ start:1377 stop:1547 length:171 start_codon:yes stop_codon:yes gene_type:complete